MTSAKDPGPVRLFGLGVVLAPGVLLVSGIGGAQETDATYTNPVSNNFADTFADPRIGLLSLGKSPNDPAATSRFGYFRVYTP